MLPNYGNVINNDASVRSFVDVQRRVTRGCAYRMLPTVIIVILNGSRPPCRIVAENPPPLRFHRASLLAMHRGCFHRSAFVEINSTRAHEGGFKLATVRGPPGTESGGTPGVSDFCHRIYFTRAQTSSK